MQIRDPQSTNWIFRKIFRKFHLDFTVKRIDMVLPGLFIKRSALPPFKHQPAPMVSGRVVFKPDKKANFSGLVARQQEMLRELLSESRAALKKEGQIQLDKERERIRNKYQSRKNQPPYESDL